jgi:glycerate 2-kinase
VANRAPGDSRAKLERVFRVALAAVDARAAVAENVRVEQGVLHVAGVACSPGTQLVVIAIGKAAAPMAQAIGSLVPDRIRTGLVVTKDGHAKGHALSHFEVLETSHPVPDERCADAGRRVLERAADAREDEVLLVLLSGGASSLISLPPDGVELDDLARTNELLLGCGADIGELNAVRKHVSQVSGGRVAALSGAGRVAVLAVSDVPGDAIDVIGSGPCAPDPSRYQDALEILAEYGLSNLVPASVMAHLQRGSEGLEPETPKPGDASFARVEHEIVASNAVAREAALREATSLGAQTLALGECIRGEARDVGVRLAALAQCVENDRPVCLVAGGESVVRLKGDGIGGRNQELALAAAVVLADTPRSEAVLLAAGTDGTDGPTPAAGGWADASTVARGETEGADARAALDRNDSHSFFEAEGGLFVTGPTGTNVMDLVLVWLPAASESKTGE